MAYKIPMQRFSNPKVINRLNGDSKKGAAEWACETAIFAIAATLAVFGIWYVIKFILVDPIRYLFSSDEELLKKEIENEKKKLEIWIQKRAAQKNAFKNDSSDPMYQFRERFIEHGDSLDSSNEAYKQWYADWKSGKVLDSDLRWEPEDTEEAARYYKVQLELHETATKSEQRRFCNALYCPNMSGARAYIEEMNDKLDEKGLCSDLRTELTKLGITEGVATFLISQNLSSEELVKTAKDLKKYCDLGYKDETVASVYIDRTTLTGKDFPPLDSDDVRIMNDFVVKGVPHTLAHGAVRGIIDHKSFLDIMKQKYDMDKYNTENGLSEGDEGYLNANKFAVDEYEKYVEVWRKNSCKRDIENETGGRVWKS